MAAREPLLRHAEARQVGLSLPVPLHERLDALVKAADAAGEYTSRKELIAALLLEAPQSPHALADLIKRYRSAPVSDVAAADQKAPPTDRPKA